MHSKIDLFIIGAQKAGTSSLLNYLNQHPKITSHQGNELPYFIDIDLYNRYKSEDLIKDYYGEAATDDRYLVGKNVGVMYSKEALNRMYQYNPEMKIVLMLRNPVERAYSAFWYAKKKMYENAATFSEALKLGPDRFKDNWLQFSHCDYLGRSTYSIYVNEIYKLFKKENVYICLFEEFTNDPKKTCNEIFRFANLSEFSIDASVKHNVRAKNKLKYIESFIKSPPVFAKKFTDLFLSKSQKASLKLKIRNLNSKKLKTEKLDSDTEKLLSDFFRPYDEQLQKLTGLELTIWKKA